MGYSIYLTDTDGNVLYSDTKHNAKGSVYVVGGTTELTLDVTYNYAPIFVSVFGENGIRNLDAKKASETLTTLNEAIYRLADDVNEDYWLPTEGNVKIVLCNLRDFARLRPDGIWKIV